jgi:hypothetical protein
MMRAGALALTVGVVLVLAPLLLGRGMLNKYIVAVGFLCACLGLCLLLNVLIDHLLRRRK